MHWLQEPLSRWSNHPQAADGITAGNPIIRFRGFQIAGSALHPRIWEQKVTTIRDDFTFSYDAGGRHDLKLGGEYPPFAEPQRPTATTAWASYRPRRPGTDRGPDAGLVPGSVERGHLEPGPNQPARAALRNRPRHLLSP